MKRERKPAEKAERYYTGEMHFDQTGAVRSSEMEHDQEPVEGDV